MVSRGPGTLVLALTCLTVITADPTNHDAKMKLAEIYEIMNEPRKALELVLEGMYDTLCSSLNLQLTNNLPSDQHPQASQCSARRG